MSNEAYAIRFPREGGELRAGGRPLSAIVEEHGSPLYVYDTDLLRARYEALRAALPADLVLTYAVKANPHPGIVGLLGRWCDGIDIASGGEMEIALGAGVPAAKMSFAGPGKSEAEIRSSVGKGIGTISLESERELDHIETACAALGREASVLIRVNPDFEFARSGLKMGGGPKQFGIDSERVPDLIRRLSASQRARYRGIHIFSGTQNLNAESVVDAFRKILEYAVRLRAETGADIGILNLGGGFGIPYFKGDEPLDLGKAGAGIRALFDEFRPRLPGTKLKIELGRYLAGECGLYVARVRYRKVSRGQVFLVLDGGMHHHLAASGNISLSPIRRQMQLMAANRLDAPVEKVNVVGPLCTPLDTFGMGVELPHVEEGDLVAIPNSGAYGISMSPAAFLGHPAPKEILVGSAA